MHGRTVSNLRRSGAHKPERSEGAWLGLTGLIVSRCEAAGRQTRH
jgi:hypothetical protein